MERILRARELLESHTPMKSDCGALCGGVCAISAALVENRAHVTPELRAKTTKLVAAFRRILGDTQCKILMQKYKTPETRCWKTVELGCQALSEVMEEK